MADIMLEAGEVIWQGDDIYIADGGNSIDQQAYLRLTCDVGESIFYPDYGSKLSEYLGRPYTAGNKALVETEAKVRLLEVQGIDEVEDVKIYIAEGEGVKRPCIYAKYSRANETVRSAIKLNV